MADEWLSAGQVAAMRAAAVELVLPARRLREDVAALCQQDGRWRALVGELLAFAADYGQHDPGCSGVYNQDVAPGAPRYRCRCRYEVEWPALQAKTQAALDGAAPPTREPSA